MNKAVVLVAWLIAFGFASASDATAISISEPLSGKNGRPAIAYDSSSNQYLVAWINRSDEKLYGRIVKADGTLVGSPAVISTMPASDEFAIAYNSSAKEYLVVWSTATAGTVMNTLYTRRIGPGGLIRGGAVKLVGESRKLNWHPALVYNKKDNRYFLVWSKEGLMTTDGGDHSPTDGIYGRFLSPSGTATGSPLLIQKMTYKSKDNSIWHLDYRGFALEWRSATNVYALTTDHTFAVDQSFCVGVYLYTFDRSGNRRSGPIKLNQAAAGSRSAYTAIAENPVMGQWLAAWESVERGTSRLKGWVFSRLLGATGTPLKGADQTFYNEQPSGLPSLVYNPDNANFLMVLDADYDLTRGVDYNVVGQFLTADGVRIGGPFIIAGATATDEAEHAVVYNPVTKNFFVVYATVVGPHKTSIAGTFVTPQ